MDEKLKEENIDYLYTEFQRELCALEDKRDALTREIGKIDEGQELLDDIYTEMRWIFREASEHCDEESFLRIMDEYEAITIYGVMGPIQFLSLIQVPVYIIGSPVPFAASIKRFNISNTMCGNCYHCKPLN